MEGSTQTTPIGKRIARLEQDERVRDLHRKGLKPLAIARESGLSLTAVRQSLRRFEQECLLRASEDAREYAAAYRHVMIDNLERLKREAWEQIALAKEPKKHTRQEMLKDADGKVTHQRAKVDTLPGETSPSLIGELRQIEVMLGRLHGVNAEELPAPTTRLDGDLIIITPAEPPDTERLRLLGEVITRRGNGKAIDVEAKVVGGNGTVN
jgi:hypothetical protein